MGNHDKNINKSLMFGWLLIAGILLAAYLGEVLKGVMELSYFLVFITVTVIPPIIGLFIYLRKPDTQYLKYYIVAGYFPMYIFVLLTGSTNLVFSYILPMIAFLVLYHTPKLILCTGIASVIVNIISVIDRIASGEMKFSDTKDGEIQIALIFLCFLGAYVAARLYDTITKENETYISMLDEKNAQIQKMAIQTISTIANTIDAKDTYTRGHSKRVSEYSAAIAGELGLSEKEVNDIRSIALLHDIGKIGVPDSVLNKPGKLTTEEFMLMKQHTIRGAEILKDIAMIPGISIGAMYHHERYDGSGYPEGLSGEQIPFIARIIAIADAYDAMNSNRIYRKHLDDDTIINEFEKGLGTQFDPKIAKVFIDVVKSGKMEKYRHDGESEDENMRILSRVMEKQEEKYRENNRTDELTGLFNRSSGEKMMKQMADNHNGCLLLIDIDNFKQINAEYGFMTGDRMIRLVAECIGSLEVENIASRFGGDEFAVFVKGSYQENEICEIVQNLIDEVGGISVSEFSGEKLSISVGIVVADRKTETIYDLIAHADKALFAAQQQGGKYVLYRRPNMFRQQTTNADLEQLVRYVVNEEEYTGDFRVDYPELGGICNLIRDIIKRSEQPIQLIMFTLEANEAESVDIEARDDAMNILETAIARAIRSTDVSTKFSSTQRLILLSNADDDNVKNLTTRIMMEFYKMYSRESMNISFSTALIPNDQEQIFDGLCADGDFAKPMPSEEFSGMPKGEK